MEFDFSVNALLADVITRLDSRVLPRGSNRHENSVHEKRRLLFQAIDRMGEASAKAQGLYGAITSGRKLELSDHILYIMKDQEAGNGKGAIVGILKIGHKKLFVYDNHGMQHEMTPMCVLDFYVHESRQRKGCGRRLFDYMLKMENTHPNHFAIDKPSHKFSMFLTKHYHLRAVIPQVNNFVVFEGFFSNRTDMDHSRCRNGRPPVYRHPDDLRQPPQQYQRAYTMNGRPPSGRMNSRPPSGKGSRGTYQTSPSPQPYSSQHNGSPEVNDLKLNPRPPSGGRNNQDRTSPSPAHLDMRSLSASAGSNSSRGLGAGINLYSRHNNTPPPLALDSTARNNTVHRQHTDPGPPMLRRDGVPPGYAELMNLHQEYQGRQGHLRPLHSNSNHSLPDIQQTRPPPSNTAHHDYRSPSYGNSSSRSAYAASPVYKDGSWTVGGVTPDHRMIASKHYTHSRLW